MAGPFAEELRAQAEKIVAILTAQGITHGHIHDDNFVLRFFRDAQGHVDFSKCPRLYLIDFDASSSP